MYDSVNRITTNIGVTSATLGWDAVSGAWGYVVRYKQTSPVSSAWTYVTVNTNSYSLTGLNSGGVYRWQIYTVCDANFTNYSGFSSPTVTCNGNNTPSSYLWSNGATTEDLTSKCNMSLLELKSEYFP